MVFEKNSENRNEFRSKKSVVLKLNMVRKKNHPSMLHLPQIVQKTIFEILTIIMH